MLILILIAIVILIYINRNSKSSPPSNGPIMYRSNGGIESHYDFLEMHGFITPAEREADRLLAQDIKNNPHKYKTTRVRNVEELAEFLSSLEKKDKP